MNNSEFSYIETFSTDYIIKELYKYFEALYCHMETGYDKELINYLIEKSIIPIADRKYRKFSYVKTNRILTIDDVVDIKYLDILIKLNIIPDKICYIVCNTDLYIHEDYHGYIYFDDIDSNILEDHDDSKYKFRCIGDKENFIYELKQECKNIDKNIFNGILSTIDKIAVDRL